MIDFSLGYINRTKLLSLAYLGTRRNIFHSWSHSFFVFIHQLIPICSFFWRCSWENNYLYICFQRVLFPYLLYVFNSKWTLKTSFLFLFWNWKHLKWLQTVSGTRSANGTDKNRLMSKSLKCNWNLKRISSVAISCLW